ncbi:unnamed protein product [Brassica rapa subsp. trilocularis]
MKKNRTIGAAASLHLRCRSTPSSMVGLRRHSPCRNQFEIHRCKSSREGRSHGTLELA